MDLFYAPNTISVASAIALEEANIPYTPHCVDFSKQEQISPDYLKINPKARVPALVIQGEILTETGAILELIAQMAPEKKLIPSDPMQAFRMREVMYYVATTMHVAHAHKFRGHRWADRQESWDDMKAKTAQTMAACCQYLEDSYRFSPYVLAEQFSLADIYLYVVCTWLPSDKVNVSNYPKIAEFIATMNVRTSVKSVRRAGILTT